MSLPLAPSSHRLRPSPDTRRARTVARRAGVRALGLLACAAGVAPMSATHAQVVADSTVPILVVDTTRLVRAAEPLRAVSQLRTLPDGGALVHDVAGRRILRFDASLQAIRVVADSAAGAPIPYGERPSGLLPFTGDSALVVEPATLSLLVLDGSGELRRVMAAPRTEDIGLLAGLAGSSYVADPQGRLVYAVGGGRGGFGGGFGGAAAFGGGGPPGGMIAFGGRSGRGGGQTRGGDTRGGDARGGDTRGGDTRSASTRDSAGGARRNPALDALQRRFAQQPDSTPIVRADFDARRTDTVAWLKVPRTPVSVSTGDDGAMQLTVQLDPMPQGDDWALLPDGTVAIVRVLDYHIDWYRPDGTRDASPRLPFDWKRLEDDDKARIVDSLKGVVAQLEQRAQQFAGRAPFRPRFEPLPADKLPDYVPPIRPGSTMADREGRLWILPATSAAAAQQAQLAQMRAQFARRAPQAAGDSARAGGATRDSAAAADAPPAPQPIGLIYDVIDRAGRLVHRVQLPAGRQLLGFATDGALFLGRRDGRDFVLERAPLPAATR